MKYSKIILYTVSFILISIKLYAHDPFGYSLFFDSLLIGLFLAVPIISILLTYIILGLSEHTFSLKNISAHQFFNKIFITGIIIGFIGVFVGYFVNDELRIDYLHYLIWFISTTVGCGIGFIFAKKFIK